jgi:formate dehydrogenase major subunit
MASDRQVSEGLSEKIEELMKIISLGEGSIVFDEGVVAQSSYKNLSRALMNTLMLSGNPEGFIPYLDAGNAQGVYDCGAVAGYLPGYASVSDPANIERFNQTWGASLPKEKGMSLDQMLTGGVKALYLTEPLPAEKLENIEFLVLQDIYPSDAMEKADAVFPACAFTEDEGTMTSFERRVQVLKPAVPGPGSARQDWKIICDLGNKMGAQGFNCTDSQHVLEKIKETVPFMEGNGIWTFHGNPLRLLPLIKEDESEETQPRKRRFFYRGADLEERIEDLGLQLRGGGA